jgi:hypothetical protein
LAIAFTLGVNRRPELAPKRRLFELADWSAYWGEDDVLARACDRRLRPKAGVGPIDNLSSKAEAVVNQAYIDITQ